MVLPFSMLLRKQQHHQQYQAQWKVLPPISLPGFPPCVLSCFYSSSFWTYSLHRASRPSTSSWALTVQMLLSWSVGHAFVWRSQHALHMFCIDREGRVRLVGNVYPNLWLCLHGWPQQTTMSPSPSLTTSYSLTQYSIHLGKHITLSKSHCQSCCCCMQWGRVCRHQQPHLNGSGAGTDDDNVPEAKAKHRSAFGNTGAPCRVVLTVLLCTFFNPNQIIVVNQLNLMYSLKQYIWFNLERCNTVLTITEAVNKSPSTRTVLTAVAIHQLGEQSRIRWMVSKQYLRERFHSNPMNDSFINSPERPDQFDMA